jgi:hypothetical protein
MVRRAVVKRMGPGPKGRLTPEVVALRRRAYEEGSSDADAARIAGITAKTFAKWRAGQGLRAKGLLEVTRDYVTYSDEEARRLQVWRTTSSDAEAADILGIHWTSFRVWARKRGLPSKGRLRRTELPDEGADVETIVGAFQEEREEERRTEAWRASGSLLEAAAKVGMSPTAYGVWARSRGLSTQTAIRRGESAESRNARYMRAYNEAGSDEEAARLARTSRLAFARWRKRLRLEPTSTRHRKRLMAGRRSRGPVSPSAPEP